MSPRSAVFFNDLRWLAKLSVLEGAAEEGRQSPGLLLTCCCLVTEILAMVCYNNKLQICCNLLIEQHLPFGLKLFWLCNNYITIQGNTKRERVL